jgi:hypothetical protein
MLLHFSGVGSKKCKLQLIILPSFTALLIAIRCYHLTSTNKSSAETKEQADMKVKCTGRWSTDLWFIWWKRTISDLQMSGESVKFLLDKEPTRTFKHFMIQVQVYGQWVLQTSRLVLVITLMPSFSPYFVNPRPFACFILCLHCNIVFSAHVPEVLVRMKYLIDNSCHWIQRYRLKILILFYIGGL